MGFSRADAARGCAEGPQRGTVDLANTMLHRWGPLGATSLGIFNCRKIAGTETWSVHAEGRAFDLGIPVGSRPELGDAVVRELLRAPDQLLQRVIWFGRVWDLASPDGRGYGGPNSHVDHVHMESSWASAPGLSAEQIAQLLGEPLIDKDETVPLIVAFNGAQWIVAPDLSSRVGLASSDDVRTLLALDGGRLYRPAVLTTALMMKIPEVRAV